MTILKPGDLLLKRYKIKQYYDAGGMQEVYLANDLAFSRIVAIKTPKNASASKRFRRSAVVSAQVNHPNVAKTLDFFEENSREFLVEEFVEGLNLRALIDQYQVLDPFLAAHIFVNVARGVAASHHVGIVHRDLKPNNILVSKELWPAQVKVSDFGIARLAKDEIEAAIELGIETSITTSATVVGALPYMAPEAITDPKGAALPSDIWSLGAMLFEMISGQKPFGQGLAAAAAIVKGDIPSKPKSLGEVSQFGYVFDALWSIAKSCLVSDASYRINADQLVEECGKLAFPSQSREEGFIEKIGIQSNKNVGFIKSNKNVIVMFHLASVYGPRLPKVGDAVRFSHYPGLPRDRAFPVVLRV